MDNRSVGIMLLCVGLLVGFITYSFNAALTDIVNASCTHGPACPMWGTIDFQTNISIAIMAFIILFGAYLVIIGGNGRPQAEEVREPKSGAGERGQVEGNRISLGDEERHLLAIISGSEGAIYQSELVEKCGFGKAKVTRLLDKLEGKGLIERRRRGMTNMVLMKKSK